jgi:uncharacterized protein YycO
MRSILCSHLLLMWCTPYTSAQEFRDGDMIFQTSKSSQSQVIQDLTHSNFSHCGIIFHKSGRTYVLEAVQTVRLTPIDEWIKRGVNGKYSVTRYTKPLSKDDVDRMYMYAKNQLGKPYDLKFQWSDRRMYCSELIYKVYVAGGVTLSDCKVFKDYDIKTPAVRKLIEKRYSGDFSSEEPVITPVDLYNSEWVRVIFSNY